MGQEMRRKALGKSDLEKSEVIQEHGARDVPGE